MKALIAASGLLLLPLDPFLAPRPPEQFTGNTTQAVEIFYATPAVVHEVCLSLINGRGDPSRRVPEGWTVHACTAGRRSMMPDPCLPAYTGESFAALACHEKGHANGWGWEYS